MDPDDVVLDDQLGFLDRVLPAPPAQVLDVGCGRGVLAAGLAGQGFDVTAIDPDPEAVAAARARGVAAVEVGLSEHPGGPYDAVIFARSLHHIRDLDDAVARTHALLQPGGVLVLDEFARDQADRAAAAFFYGQRSLLAAAGAVPGNEPAADEPVDDGQRFGDLLRRWRYDHERDPPLHDGAAMLAALDRRFRIVAVSRVPHLWRYLGQDLPDGPRGYALATGLRALETALVDAGALAPVGLRVVGCGGRT